MTREEQDLADEKMRAEIASLIATTAKLNAETAKIMRERFYVPFTVFAAVMVAVATAVTKLLV
ncbi:hypothetical protein [Pontivivens ytuae]|uniref:Uncharacterized protein n=1 Tax=Pontivivens ytuae TaxID=2789856 RepID=A0A7S9QDT3_9RHOB|nr:hypothetical protein [Pontivivens ytuae]QPH55313.1 hypothetical protein I0K15_06120 [Pontivivens ytuae]